MHHKPCMANGTLVAAMQQPMHAGGCTTHFRKSDGVSAVRSNIGLATQVHGTGELFMIRRSPERPQRGIRLPRPSRPGSSASLMPL